MTEAVSTTGSNTNSPGTTTTNSTTNVPNAHTPKLPTPPVTPTPTSTFMTKRPIWERFGKWRVRCAPAPTTEMTATTSPNQDVDDDYNPTLHAAPPSTPVTKRPIWERFGKWRVCRAPAPTALATPTTSVGVFLYVECNYVECTT